MIIMKAWIYTRRHFTSEVGERAIPTSTIEGCYLMLIHQHECHSNYREVHYYVIICSGHCLFIGYNAATKKWTCSFFVVVESKSIRNCNSRLKLFAFSAKTLLGHSSCKNPKIIHRASSSSSWCEAISRSLLPLRSFARTVCPPLAAVPRSLIHPCHGKYGGPRW